MSRIRRIGLAVITAVALALAIPATSSAIKINSVTPNVVPPGAPWGNYTVSMNAVNFFDMTAPGRNDFTGAVCYPSTVPGWGFGDNQASTPFVPRFGTCLLQDEAVAETEDSIVYAGVSPAFILTLTGLEPGENPLATRRTYRGKLWLHSYSRMSFNLTKFPGCGVTIQGPQSVDFAPSAGATGHGRVVVDDVKDEIYVELWNVEFASTKKAGCPSRIGNSVRLFMWAGSWTLKGVTVTP